jgi:D-aminopeptidase
MRPIPTRLAFGPMLASVSAVLALASVSAVLAVPTGVTGAPGTRETQPRPRARDLGITPGAGTPGALNAITDVAGVRVGQTTLISGDTLRTGVTAILPHMGNLYREKVPGGVFVGNAFGKLAGSTQVQELGTIETPIILTNTLAVGTAVEAVVRWTLEQPGNTSVRSVNALVGETNDGTLNDIRSLSVSRAHVIAAITDAHSGAVDEGAVGAGTGTIAFGWKGGIGTSSRLVQRVGNEAGVAERPAWTVGVLVQTNYGGRLTIAGIPVWQRVSPSRRDSPAGEAVSADGSCMIVIATDAPLDARDLERLAARAIFALARTGSTYSNGSGDFAIAFSTTEDNRVTPATGPQPRTFLTTDMVSGLFEAAMDATEEAVYNSLFRATDMTGNGRTIRALPLDLFTRVVKQ